MRRISLTQDREAIVDDADFDRVNQFKWHAYFDGYNWYAMRNIEGPNSRTTGSMHTFIMDGKGVDHINGNGLDNQRSNLRFANQSQNQINRGKNAGVWSSQYKGVLWDKESEKWRARIMKDYKRIHLGRFETEKEAADAYDKAALELFGEFARLNNA